MPATLPDGFFLPEGFSEPRVCLPGVLAVQGPRYTASAEVERFCAAYHPGDALNGFPLVIIVDDSDNLLQV